MALAGNLLRLGRSLRFRLALSYVVFFSVSLVLIGGFFRFTLQAIIQSEASSALEEEWGAAKGYLQSVSGKPTWFYDPYDPDESFVVSRLQRVFLLARENGEPLLHSPIYDSIGLDSPADIRAALRNDKPVWRTAYDHRTPYLIRAGKWVDDRNKVFYIAIGRSLGEEQTIFGTFTRDYLLVLPAVIVLCAVLGWFLAGRALDPLNSVSRTAQRITSSNLNTQIGLRGAGDELDHLIETFNGMMDRLNRSFEQIRQFSTDVSHELRTPLTVIRGQLEVALFTGQTKNQYRDAMEYALEGVERLSSIVRALLLLSQSETGQLVLQKSDLDLAEIVHDVADQFQIPAEGRGVKLTAAANGPCVMHADRIQIERLLSNLLSNAIKYTPAAGRVRVELTSAPGHAVLSVEDNGVGIAPEHLPYIFDRFYRVPSADSEKGLGLGLSFVAWIAKAHGGTIQVDSRPGEGTRFTVSLPAPEPPGAPLPADLAAAQNRD